MVPMALAGLMALLFAAPAPDAPSEPIQLTEHTLKLRNGGQLAGATIDDVAWLEGYWGGEAFGGWCEEFWTPPKNSGMIGMYRLITDGRPSFFEFFSLSEEDGNVILRLKHFHPDLKGWEMKDETVDFPLVAFSETELFFEGLTYRRESENEMTVYLALRPKDGAIREETFKYRRIGAR